MIRIPMKRALLGGLGLMLVAAIAGAVSPAVAAFLTALLVTLVALVAMVPAAVAGRHLVRTVTEHRAARALDAGNESTDSRDRDVALPALEQIREPV